MPQGMARLVCQSIILENCPRTPRLYSGKFEGLAQNGPSTITGLDWTGLDWTGLD